MKKLFFVCNILVLMSACKAGKDTNILLIDSFAETSNAAVLADFFDSVEILPLNFTDYFYDNMSLTYKECDDYFAVQDWNKSIRVFNKQGVIQTTISAIGRGPGEYRVIDDFDFSPQGQIKVLCNHEKIVTYTLSGEYLEEKHLDFPANNFTIYRDSSFIFWVPRNAETPYGTNRIVVTDPEGRVRNSFLPLSPMPALAYGTALVPVTGENRILCRQYYDPNLYVIDNKQMIRIDSVDFKNKALPDKFLRSMNLDEVANEMQKMQAYFISTAYENKKFIFMTVVYQDKMNSDTGAYWLIDKEKNDSKICFYNLEDEAFQLLGYPLYLTEDHSVLFIAETEKYNTLKERYPLLKSAAEYGDAPYLLLKFQIK